MKCLSLRQPWASLVILGLKRYETRTWSTNYRGPLAIHAGRTLTADAAALCNREPLRSLLLSAGYHFLADLPRGVVLGTVELCDCIPTELLPAGVAMGSYDDFTEQERDLGDYRPRRYAWRLAQPAPFVHPVALPGQLSLFDLPDWEKLVRRAKGSPSRKRPTGKSTP